MKNLDQSKDYKSLRKALKLRGELDSTFMLLSLSFCLDSICGVPSVFGRRPFTKINICSRLRYITGLIL